MDINVYCKILKEQYHYKKWMSNPISIKELALFLKKEEYLFRIIHYVSEYRNKKTNSNYKLKNEEEKINLIKELFGNEFTFIENYGELILSESVSGLNDFKFKIFSINVDDLIEKKFKEFINFTKPKIIDHKFLLKLISCNFYNSFHNKVGDDATFRCGYQILIHHNRNRINTSIKEIESKSNFSNEPLNLYNYYENNKDKYIKKEEFYLDYFLSNYFLTIQFDGFARLKRKMIEDYYKFNNGELDEIKLSEELNKLKNKLYSKTYSFKNINNSHRINLEGDIVRIIINRNVIRQFPKLNIRNRLSSLITFFDPKIIVDYIERELSFIHQGKKHNLETLLRIFAKGVTYKNIYNFEPSEIDFKKITLIRTYVDPLSMFTLDNDSINLFEKKLETIIEKNDYKTEYYFLLNTSSINLNEIDILSLITLPIINIDEYIDSELRELIINTKPILLNN